MSIKSHLLIPDRFSLTEEVALASDAEVKLLVTGICGIGRGRIKLGRLEINSVGANFVTLHFTTDRGYPLLRVTRSGDSFEVFRSGIHGTILSEVRLLKSTKIPYILKHLGAVRSASTAKLRRCDIRHIGNSLDSHIDKVIAVVENDLLGAVEYMRQLLTKSSRERRINIDADVLWALLCTYVEGREGVAATPHAATEITSLYNTQRQILTDRVSELMPFKEFWQRPKIFVGLLPYDMGVITGVTSFKRYADEVYEAMSVFASPYTVSGKPEITLAYAPTLNSVEPMLLEQIKGKSGFIRMFGERVDVTNYSPLTDTDSVLPCGAERVWQECGSMSYARVGTLPGYLRWFVTDFDGEYSHE